MKYKQNIILLCGIIFLQGFVFYGPIATLYRENRGITLFDIFLIESISWLVMILLEIPFGYFADRYGYKKTLLLSNGVYFVSKIVFFGAHNFNGFLLERLLLSVSLAGLSGCDVSMLHGSSLEGHRDRIYSLYSVSATAGFFLASVMTTWLIRSPLSGMDVDRVGFLTIFPYGLAFLLTAFLKELPVSHETRPKLRNSVRSALSNPALVALVASVALSREVFQVVTVFLNQSIYLRSGIDVRWFGLLIVVIQGMCLLSLKTHLLQRWFGHRKALLGLFTVGPVACVMLYFLRSPVLCVLGVMMIALAMAFIEPLSMGLKNKLLRDIDRATVLSVYAMGAEIIAVVVNPVIGKAAEISLGAALLSCVGLGIISVVLYLIWGADHKSNSAVS